MIFIGVVKDIPVLAIQHKNVATATTTTLLHLLPLLKELVVHFIVNADCALFHEGRPECGRIEGTGDSEYAPLDHGRSESPFGAMDIAALEFGSTSNVPCALCALWVGDSSFCGSCTFGGPVTTPARGGGSRTQSGLRHD
jgi:hypothetical protein